MFKKRIQSLNEVLNVFLRSSGIETPLQQKRIIDAWNNIMSEDIVRLTSDKYIKNQTLFIKILSPALRQDLSMRREEIKDKLNTVVGAMIIAEVRFF